MHYTARSNRQLQTRKRQEGTMLTMCPSRSCYNAFSNLRLQARKAGASQHQCFPGCTHANAFFRETKSCYSLMHVFPTLSSESGLRPSVFEHFQLEIELLLSGSLVDSSISRPGKRPSLLLSFFKDTPGLLIYGFPRNCGWTDKTDHGHKTSVTRKFSNQTSFDNHTTFSNISNLF